MDRRTLAGLVVFNTVLAQRRGLFWVYFPVYLADLTDSKTVIGLGITGPMLVGSLCGVFWGYLSDKTGKRRVLLVMSEVIAGIGFLVLAGVEEVYTLIVGLSLLEVFWSAGSPAFSALVADTTKVGERGVAMGIINMVAGLGRSAGIWVAGILIKPYGFRLLFYISASLMFLAAVLAQLLVREPGLPTSDKHTNLKKKLATMREDTGFLRFSLAIATRFLGFGSFMMLFNVFLREQLGFNVLQIGYVSIGMVLVLTMSTIPAGVLGERFGKEKVLRVALAGSAILIFSFTLVKEFLPVLILRSLSALPTAFVLTLAPAIVMDMSRRGSRATYMGVFEMGNSFAWGIGPVIGGLIVDFVNSYNTLFYFASAMQIVAISILLTSRGLTSQPLREQRTMSTDNLDW